MTIADHDDDIIDIPIPNAEDHLAIHREYCRRVIAARAPELEPAEIAEAYGVPTEPDDAGESVWLQVAEQVLDALSEVDERLTRIEAAVMTGGDDDDGMEQRGDR